MRRSRRRTCAPTSEHALALVGIPAQPEGDTVLIVLDDLTEQERRELAEREFVSNAAHELRTPLTTIIGAVEVLQGGAKDDPRRARPLPRAHRARGRAARAARARAADARARARGPGAAAARGRVARTRSCRRSPTRSARSTASALEIECPPELVADVNRDLLEQALRNLGENAAKHTRAAGSSCGRTRWVQQCAWRSRTPASA